MTDKMDAVARNKVIEESIRREQRSLKLATEYRVADARKSKWMHGGPPQQHPAAICAHSVQHACLPLYATAALCGRHAAASSSSWCTA